jgi:hypothetical protein
MVNGTWRTQLSLELDNLEIATFRENAGTRNDENNPPEGIKSTNAFRLLIRNF